MKKYILHSVNNISYFKLENINFHDVSVNGSIKTYKEEKIFIFLLLDICSLFCSLIVDLFSPVHAFPKLSQLIYPHNPISYREFALNLEFLVDWKKKKKERNAALDKMKLD